MIRDAKERDECIAALKVRYWCGEISEAVFTAGLHGAGWMCSEDIRHTLNDLAREPRPTFEQRRMEASKMWMDGRNGKT